MPEIVEARKYADFIREKLQNNPIIDINILKGRYSKKEAFMGYQR